MKIFDTLKLTIVFAMFCLIGAHSNAQEISDSFSDNEFTSNPAWSGDAANWEVVTSTAGAGAAGSMTLHQNVLTPVTGSQFLSTPCSNWQQQQTWSFFMGRGNRTFSNSNAMQIWLYANESNLESATVDGYRIHIGESGADPIRLERVTNNVGTTILTSLTNIPNGLVDFGIDIKVERTVSGDWTLYTSSIPVASGTGATADLDPLTNATVNHGSIVDNFYSLSGTAYCGVVAIHTSSATSLNAVEMDQFVLTTNSSTTEVEFAGPASATYNEYDGIVTLPVSIVNHSATVATMVDVVLTSGDASRIGSYTTQTLTFPAGSSLNQNVSISISDNGACDGIENLNFELQNVSGGVSAVIGAQSNSAIQINDDEKGFVSLMNENFESASIAGWTQSVPGDWIPSTTFAIGGTYSLKHNGSGAGMSGITKKLPNASLRGLETTWRFNFDFLGNEPSPTVNYMFYLSANEADLTSPTVDGYAVGVSPANLGDPDWVTLWRIEDGVPTTAIVTSSIDYGAAYDVLGIQVIRAEDGTWELFIDDDGGFENLVSEGTGSNTADVNLDHMGVMFNYSGTIAGELIVDDINIYQEGCKVTYYSQGSGTVDAAIWDEIPVGVGATVEPSRFKTLIVQNGHTVDMNIDADAESLKIQAGGTVNANACHFRLFGDLNNDGFFNEGTSTICLCAPLYQEIGGASTTKFYNLEMDSSGEVFMTGDVEIINVFTPTKGDFDTDGYSFTLLSDATRTASIGVISYSADFIGDVTYQRHIPAGSNQGWVMLGNCLSGATIAHWDAGLITTGFTGADYSYAEYPFNNIVYYDESIAGTSDMGWTGVTSTTDVLDHEKAYAVYMLSGAQNVEVTGQIMKWDFSQSLDYTDNGTPAEDGWNFIVNRYPSEIDWDALYDLSGYSSTIYVFDTESDSYMSYNATTGIGSASRYLAPNQAFYIQASGPGETLEYEEEIKTSNNTAYERNYESGQQIAIRLDQDNRSDQAIIGFYPGATESYDQAYDARKLTRTPEGSDLALQISTQAEGEEMMVNILPQLLEGVSIPLNITNANGGEVSMTIESLEGMSQSTCVFIEDTVNDEYTQIVEGDVITFSTEEDYSGDRFILHFSAPIQVEKADISCFGEDDAAITAMGVGVGPFSYTWYNENDEVISEVTDVYGSSEIENLSFGNYTVVVYSENSICNTVSETVYIPQVQEESVEIYTEADACDQFHPGILVVTPENIAEYSYVVRNQNNEIVLTGSSSGELIAELDGGIYELTVHTSCSEFTYDVDLLDPNGVYVAFEEEDLFVDLLEGGVLVEFDVDFTNAESVTWLINGEEVSSLFDFEYVFDEVGDYLVQVVAEGENCSDAATQTVHVSFATSVESYLSSDIEMFQMQEQLIFTFDKNYRQTRIELINLLGQIVVGHNVTADKGAVFTQDLTRLTSGTYIVRIVSNDKMIFTQKIIK